MAEVDVSSEEHAREARLSQSSNNQGQGHKRQGSGSSNSALAPPPVLRLPLMHATRPHLPAH